MTNNMSTGVTAKRSAIVVAWSGLALCVIAVAAVVRLFRSSGVDSVSYYLLGLPLTFAIATVAASRAGSLGPMWAAIGAMIGFVIVSSFSIGGFFAPAAAALILAGLAHVVAAKSRWRKLTAPLWALVGVFAIPVFYFVAAVVQRMLGAAIVFPGETREFDAPATVRSLAGFELVGSWLFVGAVAALVAVGSARVLWKRRVENPRLAAAGTLTVVVLTVLIESLAIGRAIAETHRGHSTGCELYGGKTTCWSR